MLGRVARKARQVGERRRSDDHQQSDSMLHDGIAFVRFVANATIMGDRSPATLANLGKPDLVGGVRCKVVGVPLDGQTA